MKATEEMEKKRLDEVEARALERERLAKEARLKERSEIRAAAQKARAEELEDRRAQAKKEMDVNTQSAMKKKALNNSSSEEQAPPRARSQDRRDMAERIQFRHISRSDLLSQWDSTHAGSAGSEAGNKAYLVHKPSREDTASFGTLPSPKTASDNTESQKMAPPPSSFLKPDQAFKSTPDLSRSRSRSLDNRKDQDAVPARAKSVSATPGSKTKGKTKHQQGRLFDAKGGKEADDSTHAMRLWFRRLESETQKLLEPLRKAQMKRVKIAILDTGVDLAHPDFKDDQKGPMSTRRIKAPEDFVNAEGKAHDTCGHGTHCVGLVRKMAPEADVYVARVTDGFDGILDPAVVAKAINRACNSGKDGAGKRNWNVDIITMSFGFYKLSPLVRAAIRQAMAKPVLVFAAASNDGTRGDIAFPASMTGIFCINSSNGDGGPSSFNPVLKPDKTFSIVGENIRSSWTTHQDGHPQKPMSGTSVATPIAAAVAALVLEYILQNDPESCLVDQLDEFKEYDGMSKIFALMSKSKDGYKNIVPWEVLTARRNRKSITERIKWEMVGFGGQ